MKSTELEMILIELKLLTTRYAKDLRTKRDKQLKDENNKLSKANINDDQDNAKIIRDKIKLLEEEILSEEWKKFKKFSNLETGN